MKDFDMLPVVDSIVSRGFGYTDLPASFFDAFSAMSNDYGKVTDLEKAEYSFPERTDGFLPFGMEHSNTTNRRDLCERCCYRHKYLEESSKLRFASSGFFKNLRYCEEILHMTASAILSQLLSAMSLGSAETMQTRGSSYVQHTFYDPNLAEPGREFLQDRHEDGHLLTIIAETHPGLVLYERDKHGLLANLECGQVLIFSGSMLTILSDGAIPPTYHSVKNLPRAVPRSSLAYFVIPELDRQYHSLTMKLPLDFGEYARRLHYSFGNVEFER